MAWYWAVAPTIRLSGPPIANEVGSGSDRGVVLGGVLGVGAVGVGCWSSSHAAVCGESSDQNGDDNPVSHGRTRPPLPVGVSIRQRPGPMSRWRSPPAARLNTCDDRPRPRSGASRSTGDAARGTGTARGDRFGSWAGARRGA